MPSTSTPAPAPHRPACVRLCTTAPELVSSISHSVSSFVLFDSCFNMKNSRSNNILNHRGDTGGFATSSEREGHISGLLFLEEQQVPGNVITQHSRDLLVFK